MSPPGPGVSWVGELLGAVTRLAIRRPKGTLTLVALAVIGCIVFTVTSLRMKTERADLISPEAEFHRRWLSYTESFGETADIVVVVEADKPATIKQVLDELGGRITEHPELFRDVLYKIEPGRLREKGLQYLSPEQLEAGLTRLEEMRPLLHGAWHLARLAPLCLGLKLQIEERGEATPAALGPLYEHAALLAESLLHFHDHPNDFLSPWPELFPVDRNLLDAGQQVIYLLNQRGTMGFLKAVPVNDPDSFHGAATAITELRGIVRRVSASYPDVNIGLTGIPVLENDEMSKSQEDMSYASAISVLAVGFLLVVGFRGVKHPFLALVMLAVGLAWAFGFTTLAVGHLNILSVSFAVILIGLGIDFGIHYLARYLQLRHEGQVLQPALLETSQEVGTGIATAAVTTALSFLCATLTPFLGVAELGVIAGGGILLCAISTFIVLPALLTLVDAKIPSQALPTPFQGNSFRRFVGRRPGFVLVVSILGIAVVGGRSVSLTEDGLAWNCRYDPNLLNLQADGIESVDFQKRIFKESQDSLLYAVSVAESPEEARRLHGQFAALPSVNHVEELGSRFPEHPPEETQLMVQAIRAQTVRLPEAPPYETIDPAAIGMGLEQLWSLLKDVEDPAARRASAALDQFLNRLDTMTLETQMSLLLGYEHRMLGDLRFELQLLAAASNPDPVTLEDFPSELTSRFVSSDNRWLLQIYPREQIWDEESLSRFVADVRSVDPQVTGTPLQNFEASLQIRESYQLAALYALGVICLVLLVDFLNRDNMILSLMPPLVVTVCACGFLMIQGRTVNVPLMAGVFVAMSMVLALLYDFASARNIFLALLPPLLGSALMFGILALLQVDLNPANLIVLPLVLGIGVDDGVHVIHDYRMQQREYEMSPSTMNAIVLTSLTTMAGFGSMMIAAHRGLYSVGLVLVVGVGSCLFVSLVTLPAILSAFSIGKHKRSGPPPTSLPHTLTKSGRSKTAQHETVFPN